MDALVNAWRINGRINLYLLEALDETQWATLLAKGKSVQGQFAHIHNVRLMWLKSAAPDLAEGLAKLEGANSVAETMAALRASDEAIAELLTRAGSPSGRVKGFKPDAAAFLGYLVAHESHHRAHAELALRQAGLPISDKVAYGMWEWGVR